MPDSRAVFDFDIRFANGGGLTGEGFRLDLPGADISTADLELLLVRHLGLTLVGTVEITGLEIVEEAHRGSRGVGNGAGDAGTRNADRAVIDRAVIDRAEIDRAEIDRAVIDLSHPIRAGLVTYPGLPAPTIASHLTREDSRAKYAPGTEFAMDIITMIGNTGTYLDSPFHRYAEGPDLAGLELASLVDLPAEVFHLDDAWSASDRGIRPASLADRDVRGTAVLLHTGWDRHFGTPAYGTGAPFLTGEGAQWLIDAGVVLVGIDSLNIDDTESGGQRPAHSLLLAAGVHVVEHLTRLEQLPPRGARFTAAPPAVEGFGTFPVRAYALLS
ncbi:cyclase family protein [Microbacterium pygmaeum]|uniref:Kynurenine formamidase n=1 Tax=Microbacterium pygmaeum TaxID=370764 RepID=A0A1G7VMU5_9MICO|nr:cyclase family protein [Microbacterium pygmaeum]SDG61103.1 Kynurenine formamidase [Microbacterium pygmaeum]